MDTQFQIDTNRITKQKRKIEIPLRDNINLTLNGSVDRLSDVIQSKKTNGEMMIQIAIEDEETFEKFNWENLN